MRVDLFENDFNVSAAEISVPGAGVSPQWLAETVWETEGGRLKESRKPAAPAERPRIQRRHRTT
jgi:hypothetical protein